MKLGRLWYGIIAVSAVQSAVLGWMVIDRVMLLARGREIVLEVVPVDPRSLFRGDYVILSYNISRIEDALPDDHWRKGTPLYVTLEPAGESDWRAVKAETIEPAALSPRQVLIKGRVESTWRDSAAAKQMTLVHYGIESYFVPEGEGRKLEKLVGEKRIAAVIAVDGSGNSAIKGLIIDGQLVHREPLF